MSVQSLAAISDVACSSDLSLNGLDGNYLSDDVSYTKINSADLSLGQEENSDIGSDLDSIQVSDLANDSDSDIASDLNSIIDNNSDSDIASDLNSIIDNNSDSLIDNNSSANSDNDSKSYNSDDSKVINSTNSTNSTIDSKAIDSNIASSIKDTPKSYVIPKDGHITNGYIQEIINNAAPGSTIEFLGSFYKNLNLKIDKALNIISKSGTVINSSFNLPVFAILKGGSGTNISGFTVNLAGSFVEASDVSNINILKNKIFTKRNAIVLENVHDSKIQKNGFLRFATAIDISKSGGLTISNNNITPSNGNNIGINLKNTDFKNKISILNNNITGCDRRIESTGIRFGENAGNVLLKGNIINEWYVGIDFTKSVLNVSVLNNTLNHNGDGVIINGWIDNFTFNKNLVCNSGRIGVLFDYDFKGTKGNFTLEKNYFTKSGGLDLRNIGDQAVNIGENFAKRRCVRVNMNNGYSIKTRTNGNGYYFTVVDKNGRIANGLPSFTASLNINGVSYNVLFIDSMAYFELGNGTGESGDSILDIGEDRRSLNDWGETQNLSPEDLAYYKKIYDDLINPVMDEPVDDNSNQRADVQNGTGGSAYNNGGGDSGISDGRNSISSDSVSSTGSAGSSVSASSSSSGASASSPVEPDSTSAKTLSLDEETFRVAGVGGLVFLIICVIGLYYREDIYEMIKE